MNATHAQHERTFVIFSIAKPREISVRRAENGDKLRFDNVLATIVVGRGAALHTNSHTATTQPHGYPRPQQMPNGRLYGDANTLRLAVRRGRNLGGRAAKAP